jgi:hypothetical protein
MSGMIILPEKESKTSGESSLTIFSREEICLLKRLVLILPSLVELRNQWMLKKVQIFPDSSPLCRSLEKKEREAEILSFPPKSWSLVEIMMDVLTKWAEDPRIPTRFLAGSSTPIAVDASIQREPVAMDTFVRNA